MTERYSEAVAAFPDASAAALMFCIEYSPSKTGGCGHARRKPAGEGRREAPVGLRCGGCQNVLTRATAHGPPWTGYQP
jgi:hypothetical protein